MYRSTGRFIATTLIVILTCPALMAQAPAPTTTLWSFLGIPQGVRKVNGALRNRRGNHPGLEQKPPMKSLADPANLAPEMPKAMQAAAKIKQAEDMKPQKIKAIKYLAKIGCGCYDLDGSITDALIASTKDCTEDVRLEAVQAVSDAASGECCANCGQKCCCKEAMVKRLAEMAYEKGDDGCYLEPSARVRQAAIAALEICCPSSGPVIMAVEESGEEVQPKPFTGEGPTEGEQPSPVLPDPAGEGPTTSVPTPSSNPVVRYVEPPTSLALGVPAPTARPLRAPRRSLTVRPVTNTVDLISEGTHANRGAVIKVDDVALELMSTSRTARRSFRQGRN